MPPQIDFTEEAPIDFKEGGGIDFQEDPTPEQTARFAITAPQQIAGSVMATLENPAVGIGAEQVRAQTAEDAATRQRQQFIAGGGPSAGLALIPPGPVGEIGRGIEEVTAGMARAARDVIRPTTFLPEEEQRKLRPFVITREGELEQMTRQQAAARDPIQAGRPIIPVRGTQLEPGGSDAERLIASLSTPGSIEMLAAGGASKLVGTALLASMIPGVIEDITEVAGSTASPEEKRDRINNLILPALLMLRHGGGGVETPGLPQPLRRGRVQAPEIIDQPSIPAPLAMTGAELTGRPKGFVPAVPTAGPVELGPPAPPRVRRPEVPGTPAQPIETVLETIRKAKARTRSDIQKLFPDRNLTREEAGRLRDQAWAPPVVRDLPPGSVDPNSLVPTIRLVGGRLVPGLPGETHPDIILREGIKAEDIDQRGFSDPKGQKFFLDREAAAKGTQAPTAREPGRLHSTDLPAAKGPEEPPAEAGPAVTAPKPPPPPPAAPAAIETPEQVAAKKAANIKKRIDAGIPPENVKITVNKQEGMPAKFSFVQVDEVHPTEGNVFSSNAEQMNQLGFKMPSTEDLLKLPMGKYTLPEALEALKNIETPATPAGIEGTVIAGKTLAEWEQVKDPSGLPKGNARAELARWLAVPNQPNRILQALGNKKRTREIHGPPADVAPVEPTEPEAPSAPAGRNYAFEDTSLEAKLWGAAHNVQGAAERWAELRKSGATDQQIKDGLNYQFGVYTGSSVHGGYTAKGAGNPRLWEGTGTSGKPLLSGKAIIKMAREVLEIPEPKAPAAPAPAPAPEAAPAAPPEPAPDLRQVLPTNLAEEFARLRKLPQQPPSEPKITTKVLKAQKENLLEQLDQAIKDAPEENTEQITISVPGDGEWTVFNTKGALRKLRDLAKEQFPTTIEKSAAKVGGTQTSTTKSGTARPMPKATPPKPEDVPKIAVRVVSTDPGRKPINVAYADGTQIVATDGRRLVRVTTDQAPGTPAEPVRINGAGKVEKEGPENFPNYNQILGTKPTLIYGGLDTAQLWQVANQARAFRATFGELKTESAVNLYVNPDRTIGARLTIEGDSYEHNVQEGSKNLGGYNPEYLFDLADMSRRLGHETLDLYADGAEGALHTVGKNYQHLVMPMRGDVEGVARTDPATLPAALVGKADHAKPATGLGPLRNPEAPNGRTVTTSLGNFRINYEGGKFTVEQTTKQGSVLQMAEFDRGQQNASDLAQGIAKQLGKGVSGNVTEPILDAMKELEADRQTILKEAKARQKGPKLPPGISMGPGAASPAEFEQLPSTVATGVDTGSHAWNVFKQRSRNFWEGLNQLFTRAPTKQAVSQLANAADNLPRWAGQTAGNSIRLRAEAPDRKAVTFLMQALKMSGEGLSAEDAARLGDLEFAGDPVGYLRTKQTDMETLAQRFLQEGKPLNAEAAADAARALALAQAKYNRLLPVAQRVKRMMDAQLAREERNGIDTDYERWYVPQRHDLDLMTSPERPIVLGHSKGSGTATGFRKAKVYEDYATAIENEFIPRSLDISDLLEHRVFQGERLIHRKGFFDQLRGFRDENDNQPLVTNIPKRVITRPDGTTSVQESVPRGYEPQEVMPGIRVAVHSGYGRLIRALTATSQIGESAVVGALSDIAAINKHISLALDTFHASRTLQAELALTQKVSVGEHQKRGLALVEYKPTDLDLAVNKGLITQEMADWVRTRQPIEIEGRTWNLTPHALITIGAKNGLNMSRVADVLYRQWLREMPITGSVQKWVFDKMTRSAISQSFLMEFERAAKNNPNLSANQVARMVASDINVFFGNLQKESIFKNPSFRTVNNILFLAPQWVEALTTREARALKQAAAIPLDIARGRPVHVGTVAKGIGTGLAAYFLGTQLLNLFTRGHLTFQNPEKEHFLDAWIPPIPLLEGRNGKGGFVSPLSVFGEITHDILRFAQTKPDLASGVTQIAHNKLGNMGRLLEVLATGRDPMTGERIIGTGKRAWKAGIQAIPIPILGSQNLARAGHAVFPSMVSAPPPGATQRQVFGSIGLKTEPETSAQGQMFRVVDDWKRASNNPVLRAQVERRLKEDFGPSDYKDLRSALTRGDTKDALRAYDNLLETKKPEVIRQAMAHPHPFTGSIKMERQLVGQLTPEQHKLYQEAIQERRDLNRKFQEMLRQRYAK